MKILYLTQFFSSTHGGGEVVFYLLARELARRGHEIFVIRHKMSPPERLDYDGNLRIIDVHPEVRHRGGLPPSIKGNLSYLFNTSWIGWRVVKKYGIDVVHANNFSPIIAGSLIAKIGRLPLVTTVHDVFSLEGREYWRFWAGQFNVSPITAVIGPIFEKLILKAPATIIHTVSERSRKDLIECGVKRPVIIVANGIDLSLYSQRRRKGVSHKVIFIGRLVFYKNIEVLLKAFRKVCRIISDAKLFIVGDGPMRKTWEDYSSKLGFKNNVEFTGYVSHKEKDQMLNDSCALVFPSLFEGFGLTILESFACEKPVIVSDIEPFTEIVTENYNGFLVNAGNPEEWTEKIIRLMLNPQEALRMGLNGRRLVEKYFSIQKVADEIESLYRKAIKISRISS